MDLTRTAYGIWSGGRYMHFGQELPEGFQTSEFLLKHGFVDRIVPRAELRTELASLIDYCGH